MTPHERQLLQQLAAAQDRLAELVARWSRDLPLGPVLARITGSSAIASTDYRWEYSWVEAWVGSDLAAADKSGGLTSTDAGKAYNASELSNSATLICPGVDPADIPEGFDAVPVEGHVILHAFHCSDGVVRWLFTPPVAITGACA